MVWAVISIFSACFGVSTAEISQSSRAGEIKIESVRIISDREQENSGSNQEQGLKVISAERI